MTQKLKAHGRTRTGKRPYQRLTNRYLRWRAWAIAQVKAGNPVPRSILNQVQVQVFEAMERIVAAPTFSGRRPLKENIAEMAALLDAPEATSRNLAALNRFREIYEEARASALPAMTAHIRHCHALKNLATGDLSLSMMKSRTLLEIDAARFEDPTLATFSKDIINQLSAHVVPGATSYNGAFESYAEARTYLWLKEMVPTRRLVAPTSSLGKKSAPDFECLIGKKTFYVEQKSLDAVGGLSRARDYQMDVVDSNIQIEAQLRRGASVAFGKQIIAPFSRDKTHRATWREVIERMRTEVRDAATKGQFSNGPTFLAIVADRVTIPGGLQSLLPLGDHEVNHGEGVSGVLWNACFGADGQEIRTYADLRDPPWTDGHLCGPGALVDKAITFPGLGVLVMVDWSAPQILGLYTKKRAKTKTWGSTDTALVMQKLCDAYNDDENSQDSTLRGRD